MCIRDSTYCVRFASSSDSSGNNLTVSGGKYKVDKNGLVADETKAFHSAIIIRSGASGDLKASGLHIIGEVVNFCLLYTSKRRLEKLPRLCRADWILRILSMSTEQFLKPIIFNMLINPLFFRLIRKSKYQKKNLLKVIPFNTKIIMRFKEKF